MKDVKQLKKALEGIKLTAEEKQQGYTALLQVMQANPIEKASFFSWFSALNTWSKRLAASTLLLALCTSSLSFAAESSTPGEFLYPLKIHVNEQLVTAIQFTPKAKVRWKIAQVERRLEEAEMLKENGQFSQPAKEELQEQIKGHAQEIQNQVQTIQQVPVQMSSQIRVDLNEMVQSHPEGADALDFSVEVPIVEDKLEQGGTDEDGLAGGLVDGSKGLIEVDEPVEFAPGFNPETKTLLQIDGESFELDL